MKHNKIAVQLLMATGFVSLSLLCGCVTRVGAVSTTFSQKILPINCVFEQVNDGTGTIIYLTPAECGQLVSPPGSPAGSSSPSSTSNNTNTATPQPFNPNRAVFVTPTTSSPSGSTAASQQLPYQPLTSVKDKNNGGGALQSLKKAAAVVAGAVVVIGLVVVLA